MVEDTGKTPGIVTFKPVNAPEGIQIEEDSNGIPVALKTGRRKSTLSVVDQWRIDDEWWRDQPVSRQYFDVLLATGHRMVIYKDLTSGRWYSQTY